MTGWSQRSIGKLPAASTAGWRCLEGTDLRPSFQGGWFRSEEMFDHLWNTTYLTRKKTPKTSTKNAGLHWFTKFNIWGTHRKTHQLNNRFSGPGIPPHPPLLEDWVDQITLQIKEEDIVVAPVVEFLSVDGVIFRVNLVILLVAFSIVKLVLQNQQPLRSED